LLLVVDRRYGMTTDRREALFVAYDYAASVVEGTRPDQLSLPTPCPSFDVAALIDHLVGAGDRAVKLATSDEVGSDEFPHVELADAPSELRRLGTGARSAWENDDRLSREVTMPWGETYTGSILVDMYLTELATHSFDLAAATGQSLEDEAFATTALEAARRILLPEYRNMMGEGEPFGSEVPAPSDATAWESLAAFMGRDPRAAAA
jgi:uncharacterized protein (TIGR03086 family)